MLKPTHCLAASVLALASASSAAQLDVANEPSVPARVDEIGVHDRGGGVFGTVSGQVVQPDGEPAVDARITIYETYPGWTGGNRILGRTRTDEDGQFTYEAPVFADAAPVLNVRAAGEFAVLRVPFSLATGGQANLGRLQLHPFFVLEGRVDWTPPGDRNWVQILDKVGGSVIRGRALNEDGSFRLEGATTLGTDQRVVTVRIFSESRVNRKTTRVSHQTAWTIDASRPRRRVLLTPNGEGLDIVDDLGDGPIHLRNGGITPTVLAGRVVDEGGDPVRGLLVQANSQWGRTLQTDEGARSVTDRDGRFRHGQLPHPGAFHPAPLQRRHLRAAWGAPRPHRAEPRLRPAPAREGHR